jgi:hypothetical protein
MSGQVDQFVPVALPDSPWTRHLDGVQRVEHQHGFGTETAPYSHRHDRASPVPVPRGRSVTAGSGALSALSGRFVRQAVGHRYGKIAG